MMTWARDASSRQPTRTQHTVDLTGLATTRDVDAHVKVSKALLSKHQDGLKSLETQRLRLDKLEGHSVDTDDSLAGLAVGSGYRRFLQSPLSQGSIQGGLCKPSCQRFARLASWEKWMDEGVLAYQVLPRV